MKKIRLVLSWKIDSKLKIQLSSSDCEEKGFLPHEIRFMSLAEPHSKTLPRPLCSSRRSTGLIQNLYSNEQADVWGWFPGVNQELCQGHWATPVLSHGGKLPPLQGWLISSENEELGHSFTTPAPVFGWALMVNKNCAFQRVTPQQPLFIISLYQEKKYAHFLLQWPSAAPALNFPCHLLSYV